MYDKIQKDILAERVVHTLKTIYDPEIPVNIYDLGLIYKVEIDNDFTAHITMTLTAPNCPVAESMPQEVQQKIKETPDIKDVKLTLTFDPPWDRIMINDAGLLELGLL